MSLVKLPPSILDRLSQALSSPMTAGKPFRSLTGLETLPHPMLEQRLQRWKVLAADPPPSQHFEVLGDVAAGVGDPERSLMTPRYLGGNSFIMTPPFSPSAIWVTSGGTSRLASSTGPRPLAS
jgi:hypothetical protein